MTFLQALILCSLQKINGERTVYSVYHLLKGKKSSQTIQDVHFFKLESLFQTLPTLQRHAFDQLINQLVEQSYITIDTSKQAYLTNEGNMVIESYSYEKTFKHLNGLKYNDTAIIFWKRLSLMVQVMSNLIHEKRKYYPIQRDHEIQGWIKSIIRQNADSKKHLSSRLHQELLDLFSQEPPDDPTIVLVRFTGFKKIGKTIDQAAEYFQLEKTEYWYRFLHLLHYMVESIVVDRVQFPLLYLLVSDSYQNIPLTKSTNKTYQLLKQGFSISQIASMRNLKGSTIEDHIIEIVLNDSTVNINSFLDSETEQKIAKTAADLGQKKLKPIKDQIGNVSYFQIRLALAKKGDWV